MLIRDLMEMPEFKNEELPITDQKVMVYSETTLDEEYNIIGMTHQGTAIMAVALRKDHHACIGGYLITRDDGSRAIESHINMIFRVKPVRLGEITKKFPNVLQVDTVKSTIDARRSGLGYFLYKSIIDAGYTIVSDHEQYIGGKRIWEKIVRRSKIDGFHCYIKEDNGRLARDWQNKIIHYDGKNIRERDIWGLSTPTSPQFIDILLVASKTNL